MYSSAFLAAAIAAIAQVASGQEVIISPTPGDVTSSVYFTCFPAPTGTAAPVFPPPNVIDIDINVYVTVYVTVLGNVCAGGPCDQTYTVTQTCTRDMPCIRPDIPDGFTTTVKECGCAEATQVTVTEPCAVCTGVPVAPGLPAPGAPGAGGPAPGAPGAPGGGEGGAPAPGQPGAGAPGGGEAPAPGAPGAGAPGAPAPGGEAPAPGAPGAPGAGAPGGEAPAPGAPGAGAPAPAPEAPAPGAPGDDAGEGAAPAPGAGGEDGGAGAGPGAGAGGEAPVETGLPTFEGGAVAMSASTGLMGLLAAVMFAL